MKYFSIWNVKINIICNNINNQYKMEKIIKENLENRNS